MPVLRAISEVKLHFIFNRTEVQENLANFKIVLLCVVLVFCPIGLDLLKIGGKKEGMQVNMAKYDEHSKQSGNNSQLQRMINMLSIYLFGANCIFSMW